MKRTTIARRANTRARKRSRTATQVLFVQGAGAGAHDVDGKLVAHLRRALGPGYSVRYPRVPDEHSPDDAAWRRRLANAVGAMRDGALLVGHSAGALTLIRFLASGTIERRLAGVFLIAAPYCGPGGWRIEGFDLPADLRKRLPGGVPVFLYHGQNDTEVPFRHLGLYARALPQARVRRLRGRDHQLNDDLSEV